MREASRQKGNASCWDDSTMLGEPDEKACNPSIHTTLLARRPQPGECPSQLHQRQPTWPQSKPFFLAFFELAGIDLWAPAVGLFSPGRGTKLGEFGVC